MLFITFKNELGTLRFSGGGGELSLLKAEGLGLCAKESLTATYAGIPGQTLLSVRDLSRIITLSFDVTRKQGLSGRLSEILRILYHPGTLTVHAGSRVRSISARLSSCTEPECYGEEIARLVVQFTCDHPYFTDLAPKAAPVYARVDLVEGSFRLPCIFTQGTSRKTLVNPGDAPAEPVITIKSTTQNEANVTSEAGQEDKLTLINHTSGARLMLSAFPLPGETICVSIPERRVKSSLRGNLLHCLSPACFLGDFMLMPGANDVEVVAGSMDLPLAVNVSFHTEYFEAVI